MFGTIAVAELPLGSLPLDAGADPVVSASGHAEVGSVAAGVGFLDLTTSSASGFAGATSVAVARSRLDVELERVGFALARASTSAVARLDIGDVVARVCVVPLPLTQVTTEVFGLTSHHWAAAQADAVIVSKVMPLVTEVTTEVLADLTATCVVSEE